jgi:hypothetical protein
MKIARFLSSSKQLFYFVNPLTMVCRYCETLEYAKQIILQTGVEQNLLEVAPAL